MLQVFDILDSNFLADAKLVAGSKGLKNKVTSVTVGEVPDIADWLKGGEVVLSTLYVAGDSLQSQLDFVSRLIKSKASALLVKPKRFIGKLSPEIIELANAKSFPLIEVPPELRWTEISSQIYHLIIGQHLEVLKKSSKIHKDLLAEVINGGGFESIARTVSGLIKKTVILEDVEGELLATSILNKSESALVNEFSDKGSKENTSLQRYIRKKLSKEQFPAKLSVPIVVDQEIKGFVCAFEVKKKVSDLDLIALEHAATVTAVELGKQQVKLETEIRLKGDFIDDLISKEFQSNKVLLKRASFLGCDLSKGATVLIVDIDGFEDRIAKESLTELDIQRIRREFLNSSNTFVDLMHKSKLISLKSDSVVIFLTPQGGALDDHGIKVANSLKGALKGRFERFTFSIGISRYHDSPGKIDKAFNEAKVALQISKKLGETDKVTHFEEVGIYKLLSNLFDSNPEELEVFHKETLGILENYDNKYQTELIKTLVCYFDNNENVIETSKKLFAHRHTVRYRLERISELTGLSVFRSEDKEKLALGLKISRLFDNRG